MSDYYVPENLTGTYERISPSGKYRLLVSNYKTKPGAWEVTKGQVFDGDREICEIRRNYAFTHSWVKKGEVEYLITGRSYMQQTIVNLSTGEVYDSGEADGFCWISAALLPDEKTLAVLGCYWAAPEVYAFFDFSDPARGWPQLPVGDDEFFLETSHSAPEIIDGKIVTYETRKVYKPLNKSEDALTAADLRDPSVEEASNYEVEIVTKTTFVREPDRLVKVDYWISSEEETRRKEHQVAQERFLTWMADFKARDPLYLRVCELAAHYEFPGAASYFSYGRTYPNWCEGFAGDEVRWCRRIIQTDTLTANLEWAALTGPVKLVVYEGGKRVEDKQFMPHTIESVEEAFSWIANRFQARA